MAGQSAVEHEAGHRRHLLHRVRQEVTGGEAVEAVDADGRAPQPEALVDRHHEVGGRQHVVQRVVGGVTEVAAVEVVGPGQDPDQPEARRVLGLGGGEAEVGQRDEPDPRHAALVLGAVPGQPLVVGPAGRGALDAVELGLERDEQADGRVEHNGVDALGVHGPKVGGGVEAMGHLVGDRLGVPARDHRRVRGQIDDHRPHGGPLGEHVGRLDHVGVGVQHPEPFHRHPPPPPCPAVLAGDFAAIGAKSRARTRGWGLMGEGRCR